MRAVLLRHVACIVTSAIGLLVVANAAENGARFVGTNANGDSMTMAMSGGIAILVYVITLFMLGKPGGRPVRTSDDAPTDPHGT
jgi:hypothetical protein